MRVKAAGKQQKSKSFGPHPKPHFYRQFIPNLKRKKLRDLKKAGIVTSRRMLTRKDCGYKHVYLSNFKTVWDRSVVNMVKFYRTELPFVREGYMFDQRTLYYHKLIRTERRKDNWVERRRAYRYWLWKRDFGKKKAAFWSDETRRLAKLYKPSYAKYKWQQEVEVPMDKQLRQEQSVRSLASKFYYLENIKGSELGKKELLATLSTAAVRVEEMQRGMTLATANADKRQALGFLERRVIGRLLD